MQQATASGSANYNVAHHCNNTCVLESLFRFSPCGLAFTYKVTLQPSYIYRETRILFLTSPLVGFSPLMPTRQNRDVSRKSESKHVLYTPPLQPDNTPWTPHQPVHLDSSVPLPSDASHRTPQKEAEPSSKHEGVILPGPLSPLSPEMRRLSSTRRLSGGHISTPVLAQ